MDRRTQVQGHLARESVESIGPVHGDGHNITRRLESNGFKIHIVDVLLGEFRSRTPRLKAVFA